MLAVALLSALSQGCSGRNAPERPSAVPSSAVWAGGADGGAWIDCRFASKEPHVEYACKIFGDGGRPWASGTYVLADGHYNQGRITYELAGTVARAKPSQFEGFDGVTISLTGSRVLIPHGTIELPFGGGHGKRVVYFLGKQLGPESQF
jgi:hypothetical protein